MKAVPIPVAITMSGPRAQVAEEELRSASTCSSPCRGLPEALSPRPACPSALRTHPVGTALNPSITAHPCAGSIRQSI